MIATKLQCINMQDIIHSCAMSAIKAIENRELDRHYTPSDQERHSPLAMRCIATLSFASEASVPHHPPPKNGGRPNHQTGGGNLNVTCRVDGTISCLRSKRVQ